ncbi:MAG: hypothetical protein A2147_10885 [Chloroflexi bacterium RBG_16_57_8]|nr:MAG: hypothetical protein A2147_10885 [Chloroflexi bacterium RBG_16_57_8]
MERVCIDASLALAWLSYEKYTPNANALMREWQTRGVELVGPPMFHAEVTSVLRQHVFFKRMLPDEGDEAFSISLGIPIRIVDGVEVYRTAWQMSKELGLPVCYDSQYLAVAELEDCEFWTADKKLVDTVKKKAARIRWIGDYAREQARETQKAPEPDSPGLRREM